MSKLKLYRHPLSGHSHRVELLASLLKLDVELIDIDVVNGAHKEAGFLSKNIFGQIPVLEDGANTVADSNAILVYLAAKYDATREWLPVLPSDAAEVQRFLSVAAGSVAFGPAAARLVNVFGVNLDHAKTKQIADDLLTVLNVHLKSRKWLVSDHPTIADVANYAYLAHAPEGDVSLAPYPNVRAWLRHIESLPGFVRMQRTAIGLAA